MKTSGLQTVIIFALLLLCQVDVLAQGYDLRGTVRSEQNEALAFVSIGLYSKTDTTKFITGTVTDNAGEYVMQGVAAGEYRIVASAIGYEPVVKTIIAGDGDNANTDFVMKEQAITINGVTVSGKRTIDYADRSVYTFSDEQIKTARQVADLVGSVKDLRIDPTTGKIAKAGGGQVKLLLNGINATDNDLKSIPAEKILKVEYYTIPPARYAEEGTVVNVITKRLDTGFAVGADAMHAFTTGFGDDNVYMKLTSGRHQLTADYSLSYRNYDENYATRHYRFNINGQESDYLYNTKYPFGYTTNTISLKYLYNKPEDIVLQVALSPSFTHRFNTAYNDIEATGNSQWTNGGGEEHGKTNTFSPSVDVYLNKKFNGGNELTANVVYTYFHNNQKNENRQWGESVADILLDDEMRLTNDKHSIIGELIYTKNWKRSALSVGYKGMAGKSSSTIRNHLTGNTSYDYHSANESHYTYVEWGGSAGRFGYKLSAGLTYIHTDNDDTRRSDYEFTPKASFSWTVKNGSLQASLSATPVTPTISQLSNNSEQIIPGLVKQGNPYLKSGNRYDWNIYYNHHLKVFDFTAGLYGSYTDKAINTYYKYGTVDGEDCIISTSENTRHYNQYGGFYNVTVRPLGDNRLTLQAGGSVLNQSISSDLIGDHSHLYAPLWYSANLSLGKFGVTYMGSIVSKYIDGPYLTSDENSGHLQLYYQHKQIRITAGCLFLFTKSKYTIETLSNDIMNYSSKNHIDDNKSMFVLGFSWNMFKGESINVNKKMHNADYDSGTF